MSQQQQLGEYRPAQHSRELAHTEQQAGVHEGTPLRSVTWSCHPEPEEYKGASKEHDARLSNWRYAIYAVTFVSYAMSHFSRKSYTNIKSNLKKEGGMSDDVLSQMDTSFMFFYAVGSIISGKLGDYFRSTNVVSMGLWGSAACVAAFAAGVVYHMMELSPAGGQAFFMAIWMLHGLFQSTGGPVLTAIMGNWMPKAQRGLIYGTWTCHQYLGNIAAAVVTAAILHAGLPYWWALVVPAVATAIWGFVVFFLPPHPKEKGLINPDVDVAQPSAQAVIAEPLHTVTFMEALSVPSVITYAFAFGFFKLVNYVLFFWLPYFLNQNFDASTSNLISTLYDVGMMPGGIIIGVVSDWAGGRRACVIVASMGLLCPLLFVFSQWSQVLPVWLLLTLLALMGMLIGGPNNIITSAVSADLADDPTVKRLGGKACLGTITGIINGSGSVTAAIGLPFISRIKNTWGWAGVWYLLMACTFIGSCLLLPKVFAELRTPVAAPVASSSSQSATDVEDRALLLEKAHDRA